MAEFESTLSQPDDLRAQAERCFRLAQGIASATLSEELEAIGHDFERQAELIEAALQAVLDEPVA